MQNTERPDRVAGALLQGRIALLVDGTPFALKELLNRKVSDREIFFVCGMVSEISFGVY